MRRRTFSTIMGQPSGGGLTGLAYLQSLLVSANGAVYDFTDPTTMYNDTGGTTLVSAGTPTVARINDLSGNGNHLTQYSNLDGHRYDYTEGCLLTPANDECLLAANDWAGGSGVTEFLICEINECEDVCGTDGRDRATAMGTEYIDNVGANKVVFSLSCDDTIRCDGTKVPLNPGYPSAQAIRTWWRASGNGNVRYDGVPNTTNQAPDAALNTTIDCAVIGVCINVGSQQKPWVLRRGLFFIEGTFTTGEIELIEAALAEMAGHTY